MNIPWQQLAGYFFAVVIGYFPVKLVMRRLWDTMEDLEPQGAETTPARPMAEWLSAIVGLIERSLYVWTLQDKKVEFIGLWLGLKMASQFLESRGAGYHRKGYYAFFIGNGLSVAYAGMGFLLIAWLTAESWSVALEHCLGLLLATLGLYLWITTKRKWHGG